MKTGTLVIIPQSVLIELARIEILSVLVANEALDVLIELTRIEI